MQTVHALNSPLHRSDGTLTIGNFDALHLGHLALLNAMEGRKVVLTFINHPQGFFSGEDPPKLLTLPHKLNLLEKSGVDEVILLPFTEELSKKSAEEFLSAIPFSKLVLGYDAKIGHKREGDPERLKVLSKQMGFDLSYIPAVTLEGLPVSSSRVKAHLEKGEFEMVSKLLGRPYSIFGCVIRGEGKGKSLGFPTLNLDVSGLSLPPLGVYAVEVKIESRSYKGIANLGIAPTIRQSVMPQLEVYIPGFEQNLYDSQVEVIFLKHIRPEKKFLSIDALKDQISKDVDYILLPLESRGFGVVTSHSL